MAVDLSIIKSYLVELGFRTNQHELSKFKEGLKIAASTAGEATGKIGKGFLAMGALATGALASITAGTIGMAMHVAKSDLDMQIFARRMFLTTDAARKMKMATDALGYSLEEIIFGPPELQERYHTLIKDQEEMLKGLNGAGFKEQMRNLRDVRFEFTRLGNELQYFAMFVITDLSKALFGDENGLLNAMREFNKWFRDNMPRIAESIATQVAPAFHAMADAGKHLWESLSKVDWAKLLIDIVKVTTELIKLLDYFVQHPEIAKLALAIAGGALLGSAFGPEGTIAGAGAGLIGGLGWVASDQLKGGGENLTGQALKGAYAARIAAQRAAAKLGIDPSWLYGQFAFETGNFSHLAGQNNLAGIKLPGSNEFRNFASVQEFADYYASLIQRRYPGAAGATSDADYFKALSNGTLGSYFDKSAEDYTKGARSYEHGYQPMSFSGAPVSVTVNQASATAADIHRAVKSAVDQSNSEMVAQLILMRQGAYTT